MHPAKPLFTKVAMSVLTGILASASLLSNGCVLAVINRFKSLRTVPNILIANLALVDFFNLVINMPSYVIYTVFEAGWFRGKTLGIMTSIFNRVFLVLNLASMLAMMTNIFLAISFDMKYLAWKSNRKALFCVLLIWIISIVTVVLASIPLFDIDLGDVHVNEYRGEIYKQGKHFVASIMAFFVISGAVICFLTTRAITRKKRKRVELNLHSLQEKARLKDDIKAIKTIGITIAAFFLCYVPAIVYAVVGLQKENLADSWFAFIAWYSLHISSALNPTIYYLRASRCRYAFKQFLKDPFGSSDLKQNPKGRGNGGNTHDEVMKRKRNDESGMGRKVFKADSMIEYPKRRRNAIVMSLMKELEDNLTSHHEAGHSTGYDGEKGKNEGEGRASNREVQNLCQGKVADTEEVSVDVPTKCGLKRNAIKQKRPSSRKKKIDPLEVSDMDTIGEIYGGKHDRHCTRSETESQGFSLGNQRNAFSTCDEFEKVAKTAWVTKE